MKLVALTYGTEGDTRPMAALCRALQDAGHDVSLLADMIPLSSSSGPSRYAATGSHLPP
jgi:sterol 3beta-glucosyltransferase